MKIFYINSEEFLKTHDTNFLRPYAGEKEFKSVKRFIQFSVGRYLVKSIGKKVYGLTDTEIVIVNEKPEFKYGNIKFSISHCGKYIVAAFDKAECGLDIEEMKERDLTALSKRYEKNFLTLEDFYKFWTKYEAEIKLHKSPAGEYSFCFKNNYFLTIVSENPICSKPPCINFVDV